MRLRGALDRDRVESFLETSTIPLRLGCRTPADRPWILSLWYRYVDGVIECSTAATARVVDYLAYESDVAFEVSTNEVPYTGVRGRGSATVDSDPNKETLRVLLERYLGGTDSPLAEQLLDDRRDEVTIRIEPAVCFGWDYTDRMTESG